MKKETTKEIIADDTGADEGYSKKLGRKLKELRKLYNYTQVEISTAIEVTQPTYSNYENGRRTPSSDVLYRLASYYGLLTDELIGSCVNSTDSAGDTPKKEMSVESKEKAEYMSFIKLKKCAQLTSPERELLFNFSKLDQYAQNDIIDYARFRRSRNG